MGARGAEELEPGAALDDEVDDVERERVRPHDAPRGLTARDGSGRILLFRAWPSKSGDGNRRLAGILGLFYAGSPLVDRAAMRDHLAGLYGDGVYKVIVQTKVAGVWQYTISERIVIREE